MHTPCSGSEHTHIAFGAQQRKLRTCTVVSSLSSCAPQGQAALSSAVRLTMPQPTQNPLIHVLLLWTTLLSIIQAVFIILFFTTGRQDLVRPFFFQIEFTDCYSISLSLIMRYKHNSVNLKYSLHSHI